jgi:hypothetical protein
VHPEHGEDYLVAQLRGRASAKPRHLVYVIPR